MPGTWNFRIIDRNTKAIFREYFSSLHEDSGMIFKLMSLISFTCGPRTTYCICHENIFHCFHPSICVFNSSEVQNMSSKQIFRFWPPKNYIFPCRNVWETGNNFNLVQQVKGSGLMTYMSSVDFLTFRFRSESFLWVFLVCSLAQKCLLIHN